MTATFAESAKDECYRCGYELRGIADEQACPECGLHAQRSRRATDELHDTRPNWLRSLSIGINLVLLAVVIPLVLPFVTSLPARFFYTRIWDEFLFLIGIDITVIFLFLGVIFLTRPEGYPPADGPDRRLRVQLRLVASVGLLVAILLHLGFETWVMYSASLLRVMTWTVFALLFILSMGFPPLLFLRLRGLAGRARSAHLAEHCKIVGIGASCSVVYITVAVVLLLYAPSLGLDLNWATQSTVALALQLLIGVASGLFVLWSLYLLLRFAVAFWLAARKLRRKWLLDDRSLVNPPASDDV